MRLRTVPLTHFVDIRLVSITLHLSITHSIYLLSLAASMSTADLQAVLVQTAMQQLNRVLGPKPSFTQQLASFVGIGASAPYVSLTLLGRPVRITERRTEYSYSHKVYRVLIEDCDSMTLFHGDERTSRNEARLAVRPARLALPLALPDAFAARARSIARSYVIGAGDRQVSQVLPRARLHSDGEG